MGRCVLIGVALLLLVVPSAAAKEFEPGDVAMCNRARCVPVMDLPATKALQALVYTGSQPSVTARVRLGAPYYELRFSNGYTFGIVARAQLDRFLSYGVVLERFRRGSWYRVPPTAAIELRRLAGTLRPLRLTSAAVAKSR